MTMMECFEREYMSWIGTPYFHMARVKQAGADCALFIAQALFNAGLITQVEDFYYSRTWMQTSLQELMVEGFERHLVKYLIPGYKFEKYSLTGFRSFEFQKGDILCFTSTGTKVCHHAAIYHENGFMVHSYQGVGVVLVRLMYLWLERGRYVFRISKKSS